VQHGQEEILADCDLTDARKGKMMTKHTLETLTLPPLEAAGFLLHREPPAVAGLTFAPQAFYFSACPAATSILTPSSLTFLAAL